MEIEYQWDEDLIPLVDVRWFENWLRDFLVATPALGSSYSIQVGFLVLNLKASADAKYSVWEPDCETFPIEWKRSITNTLGCMRLQKDVCESYLFSRDALTVPSCRESAIVCSRWDDAGDILCVREQPSHNDSGWFFGCTDPSHDHENHENLVRKSLYEIICYRRDLIPFLGLPEMTTLFYTNGEFTVNFRSEFVEPEPGTYMDRLNK